MERLTFTNTRSESIKLADERPYIVTKVEGTAAVNVDIQTQKSPFQDGTTYIDSTLEPRSIYIELMVLADSEKEMAINRQRLTRIFSPKSGEGILVYELGEIKREIKAISELAPVFPHAGDFLDTMQPAMLQLYCSNPLWYDDFETSNEIVSWIGGMTFPWVLPSRFAMKGLNKINIVNKGHVETPVKIEIKGPATNPKIINHSTGGYIKINKGLMSGDVLTITTEFGNKRVELNNQNVFNWTDLNSTFWQLQVGDNVIEYISDDPVEPAIVKISYRNRYVGV